MPYPPQAIANYFIRRAVQDGRPVDHLKLQKLLYFAHGWNLATAAEPLLDEPVEAWPYGPVVSSLYHRLKHHGSDPIDFPVATVTGGRAVFPNVAPDDHWTQELLDRIWALYGDYSGIELSEVTHQEGSPWHATWNSPNRAGKLRGIDIPDDLILEDFIRQVRRKQERQRHAKQ